MRRLEKLRLDKAILVEARGPAEPIRSVLLGIDGVNRVTITSRDAGISGFELGTQGGRDVREAVCQKLTSNGWTSAQPGAEAKLAGGTVRRGGDRRRRGPIESQGDLTMRHVPTLLARELGAFFLGPMAYIVLMAFQVIALLNFWELVDALSQPQREFSSVRDPMTTYVSSSPLFWFSILVAVPLLTMRLIAEERRTGTIETLLTLPVSEAEIVLSKWLAGLLMYLALLVPFAIYLPFLYFQAKYYFDLGTAPEPGHWPDDHGHDVRGDRPLVQRA